MIEKKKSYLTPEVKVVEIDDAQLICASPDATIEDMQEEDWIIINN